MIPGFLLIAILVAAIYTDLTSHRIPNVLIAPALSVALIFSAAAGGLPSLTASIGGLGVGLALFLPMYSFGAMGAGDVKLLGVAGAFLGPYGAFVAGVAAFLAGACFVLIWMIWHVIRRGVLLPSAPKNDDEAEVTPVDSVVNRRGGIPYAPAIAAGAAFAIWQQGIFAALGLG
jgi:prepilin peptidase CpaA